MNGYNLTKVIARALTPQGTAIPPILLSSLAPEQVLATASAPNAVRDPSGSYSWTDVALPDLDHLWLGSPGFLPVSVELHASRSSLIDLGDHVLEPATGCTVRTVSAHSGEPIPQVVVRFTPQGWDPGGEEQHPLMQRVTTDDAGQVRLRAIGIGLLQAHKEGWVRVNQSVSELPPNAGIVLPLEPEAILVVRCTSLDGAPVPRAPIQWRSGNDHDWSQGFADDRGTLQFGIPPGDVELRYTPGALRGFSSGPEMQIVVTGTDEYDPRDTSAVLVTDIPSGERREVTLQVPAIDSLEVLVTKDGKPAERARIVVFPGVDLDPVRNDVWGVFDLPRGITDEAGHCAIAGVPFGAITIVATDSATNMVATKSILTDHRLGGPVMMNVDLRSVRIHLLDERGSGVAGVDLVASQASARLSGVVVPIMARASPAGLRIADAPPERVIYGTTNEAGIAEFTGLPQQAALVVSARRPTSFPFLESADVEPGQDVELELSTDSGAALELTVAGGDGLGSADTLVVLRSAEMAAPLRQTTDPTGSAAFYGLRPGTWSIELPFEQRKVEVHLEAGRVHEEYIDTDDD